MRSKARSVRGIRAPSFAGFRPASPASSRAKAANRPRDTGHELALQTALRQIGLRFETHRADLPGRPDVVFEREKLAVFCDGDFWHGRNWRRLSGLLARRANAAYWIAKIDANRRRDLRVRRSLKCEGWTVVRVWETDILRDPESVASSLRTRLAALRRQTKTRRIGVYPRTGIAARKMPSSR